MTLKVDDLHEIGLPIPDADERTLLYVESAFDWMKVNTTLVIDLDDIESLKALPPVAKLFVIKFLDIMALGTGVTSESIDTLSHSFDTDKSALIWQYAEELLGYYLKSRVKVYTAKKKW